MPVADFIRRYLWARIFLPSLVMVVVYGMKKKNKEKVERRLRVMDDVGYVCSRCWCCL